MGSSVSRVALVLLAVVGVAVPAVALADATWDVSVQVAPAVTVGAGEPFTWEPFLSQCGGCTANPTPPTIHFSTTLPPGVMMLHAGFRGSPGQLDNCLTNCAYTFDVDADRSYSYSLVATAPGTYQLSTEIVLSNEPDPNPSNNSGVTALTVEPLVIEIASTQATKPRAGHRFTWAVEPTSAISGSDILPAKVTCVAHLGAKSLAGASTRTLGKVTCAWKLPAKARGETLRATVGARLAAASASISRTFKVSR